MDCYLTDTHVADAKAVALEDSIMLKGSPATAGSKILENFIAPFDATVVTRLREHGIAIAGKTKMREFGLDRISPDRPDELSGAVQAVADHAVPYALCNDVFGVNRRQAAEHGVCYLHPTYGTVSRYGLIPSVSSMDQIGIVCRNLTDGFRLLPVIAGHDPKDGAMFPEKRYTYAKTDKKLTVAVPEIVENEAAQSFAARFNRMDIDLPYFDVYKQVMMILSCAELSNNINRYDGIKFGTRAAHYKGVNDLYVNSRTQAFDLETKLAAVMGSLVLSQEQYVPFYEKAMKIRRLIKDSLRFDTYDIIVMPTAIGEDPYENLALYALAPLAGLPSVSFSWQGQGLQLIAAAGNENALLTAQEVSI